MRTLAFALAALVVLGETGTVRAEDFPRRLLVIHVGHPLYLGSLTSRMPGGPDRVGDSAERLALAIRIPMNKANHQLFVLSDTAGGDRPVPTRSAIEAAVKSFCATSRTQDRVVLYFAGHAFVRDGKAYFAPVEGDPTDATTLVPVAEVYAAIKAGRAAQTVVLWDVCRQNPERPAARPDGGSMTADLAKLLADAPPGVQVVLACSAGERSIEYTEPKGTGGLFAGSAFLDAFHRAADDAATAKKPAAADAIPIAAILTGTQRHVTSAANEFKLKQTLTVAGKPPTELAAPVASEQPAKPIEVPVPTAASRTEVKAVFDELALPPLLGGDPDAVPYFPFAANALKPYAADATLDEIFQDVEKYRFRVAVLRALQTVRDTSLATPKGPKPLLRIDGPVTEKFKRGVLEAQEGVAVGLVRLELDLAALEALEKLRAKEPKRWQAHFDYALGETRVRLAALNEYNRALGDIRTERLPDRAPGSPGWRLVPDEKIHSKTEVRKLAEHGAENLTAVATRYKGTPWEVLARRTLLTEIGLKWEPVSK